MQIMLHSTDTAVDTHIVVVEDDEQVVGRTAGIIESFERKTAAHTAVTDYSHHLPVVWSFGRLFVRRTFYFFSFIF